MTVRSTESRRYLPQSFVSLKKSCRLVWRSYDATESIIILKTQLMEDKHTDKSTEQSDDLAEPKDERPHGGIEVTEPYSTFTSRQKWLLVFLASVAATFSGFASNIYFPALPAIAGDLHVSVSLVNLTVTSYMIFQGIAPPIWGAISDVKGRRVAYICTFVVFLGACIGLANTQKYATLLVLRCLQSTGSASTIAIGSGVIGDLTARAERGGYMVCVLVKAMLSQCWSTLHAFVTSILLSSHHLL